MKYSQSFVKTFKNPPKEADTVNHKLLTQAGFVDQLMAGVFSYLPMGLRVLKKIEDLVREEMNALGSEEILMPILHPSSIWETTGGWEKIDVLFKIKSRTEKFYALAQSAEEVVTPLVMSRVNTYKDLPISVYQSQWKYRDELRSKSGILRGREFLMKDMYSFHESQEDFIKYYEKAKQSYINLYKRMGLTAKATEASGGSFTQKLSYEFMVLTDAGEDDIYYCTQCDYCINKDIAGPELKNTCPKCGGKMEEARASEVGNVFDLGQKYGKDFGLTFIDRKGNKEYPYMGCYGFGISRTMGVIVEKFHDDKGIIWPESVAPYQAHLVGLDLDDNEVKERAEKVYKLLEAEGIEVLYDDRVDISAGAKFADADLIGIPYKVVISKKTQDKLEVKKRNEQNTHFMSLEELINVVSFRTK